MIVVRPAHPKDADATGELHVRAWRSAYRGLMPAAYLDGLKDEERAAIWARATSEPRAGRALLVAERSGSVVGSAAFGPSGAPPAPDTPGELYAINVDPQSWGVGVGWALLRHVHAGLTNLGFDEAILWVHPENARARNFYERAGWMCDDVLREAEVLGVVVPEVRYHRALVAAYALANP